jgi:hypothetical protein
MNKNKMVRPVQYDRKKHGAICKYYVSNKCKFGKRCKLYHPPKTQINTPSFQKEIRREPGHCYCGSYLRSVISRYKRNNSDDRQFFVVCSNTGRSMSRCNGN